MTFRATRERRRRPRGTVVAVPRHTDRDRQVPDGGGPGGRRRALAGVLVLLVALLLTGCSRELGGPDPDRSGPGVATSPDAARTKLALALTDPCYTDPDPRSTWPRCGRWAEEATSTARSAASALPNDAAVTAAGAAVSAGRDLFVSRGCASQAPTVPVDAGACIGALITTRTAVGRLDTALRAVP